MPSTYSDNNAKIIYDKLWVIYISASEKYKKLPVVDEAGASRESPPPPYPVKIQPSVSLIALIMSLKSLCLEHQHLTFTQEVAMHVQ